MRTGAIFVCLKLLLLLAACQPGKESQEKQDLPAPAQQYSDKVIRCRVADFPPQYYRSANGEWTGLDVELIRAIVHQAGYEAEFTVIPWSRALDELRSGRLQLMANMTMTEERSAYLRWIGPQRTPRLVLIVRPVHLELPISSVADLVLQSRQLGLPFGVQQGVFYSTELNTLLDDADYHDVFEAVSVALMNYQKLLAGRILGTFEDYDSSRYQINTNPAYAGLAIHPFVVSETVVYIGASRAGLSDKQFMDLQTAYHALEYDGSLQLIRNRAWGD